MTTTTRYAHLSTEQNQIQEEIADMNDERARSVIAEIFAEAAKVLGAERLAEIRAARTKR